MNEILKQFKVIFIIAFFIFPYIRIYSESIIINEIMQSNVNGIMDDLNDFPDSWIELYNTTENVIDITGYAVGLSDNYEKAFKFRTSHEISFFPKDYIIIYCDKIASGFHTDFRLETNEDSYIYLFDSEGNVIDKVFISPMPAPNISYGRKENDPSQWGYMLNSTPGSVNNSETSTIFLPEPIITPKGGLLSSPTSISISIPSNVPEGTIIRYTTDGSEPSEYSSIFSENIIVDTTTIIKAKLFAPNALSIPSTTQSYIFHNREVTLPVFSITTDDKYLYDPKIGIYTAGDSSNYLALPNYQMRWRRPANIEYFPAKENNSAVINQLGEIRIGGNPNTSCMPLKSLVVYANKRFGKKRFKYPFWQDKPNVKENKSFLLRNSGNDFLYSHFRDAVCQTSFGKYVDLDWQAYQPTIVYINGKYKGILNLRERANEDYVYANYNKLEDLDMIENWRILQKGDSIDYKNLVKTYSNPNVSYSELDSLIDIQEFMNLMILETFHANMDFPGNNIVMWKPKEKDKKWRWIVKDVDYGWGYLYNRAYENNYKAHYFNFVLRVEPFEDIWSNAEYAVLLFQRLMDMEKFRNKFTDRLCIYLGDFLNERHASSFLDSLASNIEYEYPFTFDLYNDYRSEYTDWYEEIKLMKGWLHNRIDFITSDLKDFYSLGEIIPIKINNNKANNNTILFNQIPLITGNFDGKYYAGKTICLKVINKNNTPVLGWLVNYEVNDSSFSKFINEDSISFNLSSEYENVTFNLCYDLEETGIENPEEDKFDLEKLSESTPISIYNMLGKSVYKGTLQKIKNHSVQFSKGIYLIQIKSQNSFYTFKTVIK